MCALTLSGHTRYILLSCPPSHTTYSCSARSCHDTLPPRQSLMLRSLDTLLNAPTGTLYGSQS